jgi:protein-arginine kinase activator protein McsA
VRFNCPINTYEFILSQAGIILDDEAINAASEAGGELDDLVEADVNDYLKKSTEELKQLLDAALADEDYEKASRIRDEINNRKKS